MIVGNEAPRIFTPPLRELTPETSLGFAAAEFAEDVLGIRLFPWQRWMLIHSLETLPDGTLRFRTVVLLVARQNGKSTLLQIVSLFFIYVCRQQLVIGTAQNLAIAEEVWQGAIDLAEGVPQLREELAHLDRTNGSKALVLKGGQRYLVQAANRRGGRGLSADLVLLDELREHQKWDAWGAVTKTTLARPHAQVWAASNAGDRYSVVLKYLRQVGHTFVGDPDMAVGDGAEPPPETSLGLFEWSAKPGLNLDDLEGIKAANPSLGWAITQRAIDSAAQTDPEDVFRTEVLCQWVDNLQDSEHDLNPTTWARCEDHDASPDGPLIFAADVAPYAASASISVCGEQDGVPVVELVENQPGTDWLVPRLLELQAQHSMSTVAFDPSAPIGMLLPQLEESGLPLTPLDAKGVARATLAIVSAVANREIRHRGQQMMASAVAGSRRRSAGDGQRWSRTDSSVDISPLVAATYAYWLWVSQEGAPISPTIYFI